MEERFVSAETVNLGEELDEVDEEEDAETRLIDAIKRHFISRQSLIPLEESKSIS